MKYLFSFLLLALVLFSCSNEDKYTNEQTLKIVVEYSGELDMFEGMTVLSADKGADITGSYNLVLTDVEQNVYSTGYIPIDNDTQEFYSKGAETFTAALYVDVLDGLSESEPASLSADVSFFIDDKLISITSFEVFNGSDDTNYFYYKLDAILGKAYVFNTDIAGWHEL
ncbi:beta-barrel fold lipoprotein [uncultured Draconibacterium sp.]|uniref:beta-barrel fold lipoprotein n=1 Tax=uncultured Draconibacterium sp. TaxID=1573823 RepID=UPI0029C6B571|nr:hypothetical protein [uncultured Draconibacterium sp.]